ncbi:MAG: 7-carboxy-7-deazaguanine synthase QueE [Bacteroidetes bacterium]|nr:7-carboxy-7-deazaguanine synthase QueE [Bacteroidota bacterium]
MKTSLIHPATALPVMESFYTIQGEGFYQGHAAYFIRLAGCDVGCVWCDVKESWNEQAHPIKEVAEMITEVKKSGCKLVVITGGEPAQHNLEFLTNEIQNAGRQTHIETSGAYPLTGKWNWVCLSPKKFKPPHPSVFQKADELKIIVYNKSDFSWAEENAAHVSKHCHLFLQPEWSREKEIMPEILNYVKANPAWKVSLQIHKYMNIP